MAEAPSGEPGGEAAIRLPTEYYPVTLTWGPSRAGANLVLLNGGETVAMGAGGSVLVRRCAAVSVVPDGIEADVPDDYLLGQNTPNPFNPSTTISFVLPVESHVTIGVYSTLGKLAGRIVERDRPAGSYSERWRPGDLPSGGYSPRMEAVSLSDPQMAGVRAVKMLPMKSYGNGREPDPHHPAGRSRPVLRPRAPLPPDRRIGEHPDEHPADHRPGLEAYLLRRLCVVPVGERHAVGRVVEEIV
jgi:hypothetical protein